MFNLRDSEYSVGNQLTYSGIPHRTTFDDKNLFFKDRGDLYRYDSTILYYYLRNDSEFIPITCAINENKNGRNITSSQFSDKILRTMSQLYRNSALMDELEGAGEVKQNVSDIYKIINRKYINNYSRNIPIGKSMYYNSSMKQSKLQNLFLGKNIGRFNLFDRGLSTIHPFFYVYQERIMMMLVVKKEFLAKFKLDLIENKINPNYVEFWVDKRLIHQKDRKMFHKYVREKLMMKLTLEGFKIKEKDCILSELTYVPKFKFNNISEIVKFKKNVNKMLLS